MNVIRCQVLFAAYTANIHILRWQRDLENRNKKLMAPQKMTKAEAKKLLGIKNGNYMKTLVKKCAKCAKMQRNCCILAHSPLY